MRPSSARTRSSDRGRRAAARARSADAAASAQLAPRRPRRPSYGTPRPCPSAAVTISPGRSRSDPARWCAVVTVEHERSSRRSTRRVRGGAGPGRPAATALLERGSHRREEPFVGAARPLRRAARPSWRSSSSSSATELVRHLDVDAHEQIAATAPAQRRDAAALEPEHVTGLRARRARSSSSGSSSVSIVEAGPERRLRQRRSPHVRRGRRPGARSCGSAPTRTVT